METEIRRQLRKAMNLELPMAALPAIVSLKRQFEELERSAIAAARSKGASWEDVAEVLGVTRQALQQRSRRAPAKSSRRPSRSKGPAKARRT